MTGEHTRFAGKPYDEPCPCGHHGFAHRVTGDGGCSVCDLVLDVRRNLLGFCAVVNPWPAGPLAATTCPPAQRYCDLEAGHDGPHSCAGCQTAFVVPA